MAEPSSIDPTQPASSGPTLAKSETELVAGDATKGEEAPAAVSSFLLDMMHCRATLKALDPSPSYADYQQTLTEQATNAATSAASTVTAAASNVTDSVFSMFGGGAKKEKKDEDEDRGDNSGSAKAQKAAAAEENPEVRASHENPAKLETDN